MSTSPTRPRGHPAAATGLSLALAGSGGSGVMTAGTMLLDAAGRAGLYGLMVRTSGPQIRGGEAAALMRLATGPTQSLDDAFDLLLAIDWGNVHRFADEVPLRATSVVIGDADEGEVPEVFRATGARVFTLPLKKMAKAIPGSWINMLALGLSGTLTGVPAAALEAALRASWKRGEEALKPNLAALRAGIEAAGGITGLTPLVPPGTTHEKHWLISGNEAAGLGAIRGGVRFVAAYPITPATELLEWISPALTQVGGSLLQAEDELASINMIIGASYGGVPSLTATAGPGLSLMAEALGLAVSAEVPIVVVDVMRGGPSTGIPAKTEQSDLSFAVWGLHGDAPRLVLAPTSIADCVSTTQWAVQLAEALQAPAIVLSDQFMGQARAIVPRVEDVGGEGVRLTAAAETPDYKRYRSTPSGISPMAVPGRKGTVYTADGLETNEAGIPSSNVRDHQVQLDKRARKLELFQYGPRWADVHGTGELAVITFGSTSGAAQEAIARAAAQGVQARLIVLRLIAPAQPEAMAKLLAGVRQVLVVEQNHGAQLFRYLRAMYDLPGTPSTFHRAGPLPLRPAELAQAIVDWAAPYVELKEPA